MQQYKAYWEYDLAAPSTALNLQLSDTCTLSDAYIGAATISVTSSPFTGLYNVTDALYITTDEFHYKTTIQASLGFQGLSNF
jgi:hypothetical protein